MADAPDPDVAVVAGADGDGSPVTVDAVVNQPHASNTCWNHYDKMLSNELKSLLLQMCQVYYNHYYYKYVKCIINL